MIEGLSLESGCPATLAVLHFPMNAIGSLSEKGLALHTTIIRSNYLCI